MSEKLSQSNPEFARDGYLIVLPDGSVGRGFTTGNFRGEPLLQRNGTRETMFMLEVRYEAVDSNGESTEQVMHVPEHQLSPEVQAILRQRQ